MKQPDAQITQQAKPVSVRLRPSDFEKHGYTGGCLGCKAILSGKGAQSHSPECRKRMESILSQSEEGRKGKAKADDRINAYIADRIEHRYKLRRGAEGDDAQKDVPITPDDLLLPPQHPP